MTNGQAACEAMNQYQLSLYPDSPGVSWEGLSDEGKQGWEVTAQAVCEPLRAENERLRGLLGESVRLADASKQDLSIPKEDWDKMVDEWLEGARETLK